MKIVISNYRNFNKVESISITIMASLKIQI